MLTIIAPVLCLGLLSSYTLAPQVYERINEMKFPILPKVLFFITVSFGIFEKVLSCKYCFCC